MGMKKQNNNIDWEAAKLLYIAGKPDSATGFSANYSYADIGKVFNIATSSVGRHGKKEGWLELRKQYKEKRESSALDILSRAGIDDVARIQATNVAAAMGTISRFLATLEKKNISAFEANLMMKYLDKTILDITEADNPDKPTADQIMNLTGGDIVKAMLEKVRAEGIF